MSGKVYRLYDCDGNYWTAIRSLTYRLSDIIRYLSKCAEEGDSDIAFVIRETGDLEVMAYREDCAGELEQVSYRPINSEED